MLHRIIQEGHEPLVVIEEDSSLATKNELSLVEELKWLEPTVSLPPCLEEIVAGRGIQCVTVGNHNDADSQSLLESLSLDLIVLGDTRIIRPNILTIPKNRNYQRSSGVSA